MAHVIEISVIYTQCHYNNRHKGKVVSVKVVVACRGYRGIASVTLDLALDGVSCQHHIPEQVWTFYGKGKSFYPLMRTKSCIIHLKTNSLH
jgi:hypothetical protein